MNKKRILILAEGFEEKPYIEKLINFPCISKNYIFLPVVNLKGNGEIVSRYQYKYQTTRYDLILVFADADKGSKQFIEIIEKLGENIFGDKEKGKLVFMFVNPVTLQVILSHFDKVKLLHTGKKENAIKVKELTGIEKYDAKEEQIKELIGKINSRNYIIMKENIKELSTDYKVKPSTNILSFLKNFENDDTSWVDEICNQISVVL